MIEEEFYMQLGEQRVAKEQSNSSGNEEHQPPSEETRLKQVEALLRTAHELANAHAAFCRSGEAFTDADDKALADFNKEFRRLNPKPTAGAEHQPIKCPKCGTVSTTMGNSSWHSCAECCWNWDVPAGAEQKPSQDLPGEANLSGGLSAHGGPCAICEKPIGPYDSYGVSANAGYRYHWDCIRREAATVSPTQTPPQAGPMEWERQGCCIAYGTSLANVVYDDVAANLVREHNQDLATLRRELSEAQNMIASLQKSSVKWLKDRAELADLRARLAQAEAALRFYASTIYPDDGSGRPADAFQRVAKDYFANTSVLPRQGDEFEQWWTEHKDACPFPDKAIYRVIWQELSKIDKARGNPPLPAQSEDRPCTCHPDDNPPVPCAKQYAFSECESVAEFEQLLQSVLDLLTDLHLPNGDPDPDAESAKNSLRAVLAARTRPAQSEEEFELITPLNAVSFLPKLPTDQYRHKIPPMGEPNEWRPCGPSANQMDFYFDAFEYRRLAARTKGGNK